MGLPRTVGDKVMLGSQVESLDDEALNVGAVAHGIFANLMTLHKERSVRALRANGQVVGFMGDGINDAPAIGRKGKNALATSTRSTLPKLELAVMRMYFSMLQNVVRPCTTPSSSSRLLSSRMMSAASLAMPTALSTLMPKSAARRGPHPSCPLCAAVLQRP